MSTTTDMQRRKVRKGTHSCWECRRRKIRCQFGQNDAASCLPCEARGSVCRSQEFANEACSRPTQDKRMAQRLGRLEEMMAMIADRIMPKDGTPSQEGASNLRTLRDREGSSSASGSEEDGVLQALESLEASLDDDTPVRLLLGLGKTAPGAGSMSDQPTPDSGYNSLAMRKSGTSRNENISRTLHALFPPKQAVDLIVTDTPGSFFIVAQFFNFRNIIQGDPGIYLHAATIPPPTAHPAALARRLLGLCICMQQLPPDFDLDSLQLGGSLQQTMAKIINTVRDLVTSNDELVGNGEGLQSLILQGIWHSNAGNLRKAWLSFRRALSFGQLIGIDRGNAQALRFLDTTSQSRPTPDQIWYRAVHHDRNLSLLLGLPIGSTDNSFAKEEAMQQHTKMERLERQHAVIAARIVERNNNRTSHAYAMTQAIDCDLEVAARSMGADWWDEPDIVVFGRYAEAMGEVIQLMLQVRHYDLLVLLHLPFMLRDPADGRYDYSRATCARVSREILKRYVTFRSLVSGANSCRHIDYSGLIASMTLLLSYLGTGAGQPSPTCPRRAEDRKLVEMVRERMQHMAVVNQDKLSRESADILSQMLPILDAIDASLLGGVSEFSGSALKCLRLSIPYLGTVSIQPGTAERPSAVTADPVEPGALPVSPPTIFNMTNTLSTAHLAQSSTPVSAPEIQANFPPVDPALESGMYMDLDSQSQLEMFGFPDMTAEVDDWTLQGVDTAYWSLLNNTTLGDDPSGFP